jgi:hypothetical protein
MNNCQPGCECGNGNGLGGPNYQPSASPPGGRGVPLCWGIAGASIVVAAATPGVLTITVANYAWLRPRRLVMTAADPLVASDVHNVAALVNVDAITGLGRQVLGSAAGVNAGAIDAYAERALSFGRDISPITSSNNIVVNVTNNHVAALRISATIEGEAQQ